MAEGLKGLTDFVGYPTGVVGIPPPPPVGIYPFDFVGYPVGVEVAAPAGKVKYGGRELIYALLAQEEMRRQREESLENLLVGAILRKVEERYGEYERQRREMLSDMTRAVLLAEI